MKAAASQTATRRRFSQLNDCTARRPVGRHLALMHLLQLRGDAALEVHGKGRDETRAWRCICVHDGASELRPVERAEVVEKALTAEAEHLHVPVVVTRLDGMRGQPLSAEVAEGRLYIVGKKSNVLVANFYISQILAIYTSASTPPIYKVLCATVKSPRRTQTNPSRSSLLAFRTGRSKSGIQIRSTCSIRVQAMKWPSAKRLRVWCAMA